MLFSFVLIAIIAFGGLALTYLFTDDEPFLWRLAAGNVIGSAVFGTVGFVAASFFGLQPATVLISLAVTAAPLILLQRHGPRTKFKLDWDRAKGKLDGASFIKFARFLYYALFLLLFLFFFDRAMFENDQGIFTGGSQNLGDLPFHLGAIFGFADGNNFPPQNPSFAGARFSYPFIADFLTACFVKLGIGVREAMLMQNVLWAFSLLVVLERFVLKLLNDRFAAKIAPPLLFFSGGLGFIWFFGDFWAQGSGLVEFLWHLPKDYTISDDFRWGNSLVTLFITQRSLLLGMPLALIVLGVLWNIFSFRSATKTFNQKGNEIRDDSPKLRFSLIAISPGLIVVGLLAGMLVLIHLHSLAVLFIVGAFLFIIKPGMGHRIELIIFAASVALIAVPELIWSMSGSATETSKFFEWHFGWDKGDKNFFWFWFTNTGIFIPLLAFGVYLVGGKRGSDEERKTSEESRLTKAGSKGKEAELKSYLIPYPSSLLLFYLPFLFLFLIANVAKLAPWEWDNIKVLIYWFVGSVPFLALALAWMWRKSLVLKVAAAFCFIILIFSGSLDVWRTASGQIKNRVFEPDAMLIAERIKQQTESDALFLSAPTYNSAVVLSGRRSLMRYPGHLGSHGIDYSERESDVKKIYLGGTTAEELMRKYAIDYVLISPVERSTMAPNEAFFRKYPVIAEAGQYKVYKVR